VCILKNFVGSVAREYTAVWVELYKCVVQLHLDTHCKRTVSC